MKYNTVNAYKINWYFSMLSTSETEMLYLRIQIYFDQNFFQNQKENLLLHKT